MSELDDDAITVTLDEGRIGYEGGRCHQEGCGRRSDFRSQGPIRDAEGSARTANTTPCWRGAGARDHQAGISQRVQLDTVLSGIQAAEAEATTAEKEYVAADEAGDLPAKARAMRKMGAAEARIERLKEAEADLKDQTATKPTKPAKREQPPPPQQQPPSNDPIAAFTQGMSAKSTAWIRAHPDCVTDPKKNARMLAAHNLAMADDIAVDTPEYFERIEAGITPVAKKADPEPPKPVNIRPSAPVASGANAGGGMNGSGAVRETIGAREELR